MESSCKSQELDPAPVTKKSQNSGTLNYSLWLTIVCSNKEILVRHKLIGRKGMHWLRIPKSYLKNLAPLTILERVKGPKFLHIFRAKECQNFDSVTWNETFRPFRPYWTRWSNERKKKIGCNILFFEDF